MINITGRERLLTAINNKEPDRLPCLIHACVVLHPSGIRVILAVVQADMLDMVACPKIDELSALGSCLMAGLAAGIWKSLEELKALREQGRIFLPAISESQRVELYRGWKEAVRRTLSVY